MKERVLKLGRSFISIKILTVHPSHSISACYNDNERAIWQTQTQMRAGLRQMTSSGVFTQQQQKKGKEKSIVTIRTRRVGGTTRVCCVHVCFLVCALISTSAAVPVKPGKHGEEERRQRASVSLGSLGSMRFNLTDKNITNSLNISMKYENASSALG